MNFVNYFRSFIFVQNIEHFYVHILSLEDIILDPFQSYIALLGTLKAFLQKKDLKNTKRNSVCTEPPTANHLTDSILTRRGIEPLPSNEMVSICTATLMGLYCHAE